MLHPCLDLIRTELNAHIKTRAEIEEDKIILANLGGQGPAEEAQLVNKVTMSVVDIVQEEQGDTSQEYIPQRGGGYLTQNQPLNFNIHLLFSAYSKTGYVLEGLKYLSLVIAFFQSKNYFDTGNTPLLQQLDLDSISMELVNLSYQEKSALWTYIGAPYVPSVLYKLGIIPVEDKEAIRGVVPEIRDIVIQ